MDVVITADRLADLLASEVPPVLLDVRWRLGGPPGREEYAEGHLPGAVYVDLETELARHGTPEEGRHPLPDPVDFQAAARSWGVSPGRLVVAYDDNGAMSAARAWWLLRWAGHGDVLLLDGGLAAWRASGHELTNDSVDPAPGSFVARPGALPVLGPDDLRPYTGVLLDARASARFRGETEPIDPIAGHVPGARNLPSTDLLAEDGTFLPPRELRHRFAAVGVAGGDPVGVYCGSGISAAHEVAALAIAGLDGALYPGSWSQWSNLGLPVATGD
ncbi:sulfurtransferase [Nocardioides insulae]|uniref:sulfurtransferase n=1 Tax=Nocardioides insulae TaxID=394734 RepID=UPI000421B4DA|nr:sulfurtransferase [Nocardioides insulae]